MCLRERIYLLKSTIISMEMFAIIILGFLTPLAVAQPSSLGCSKGHGRSLLQSEGLVPYNPSGKTCLLWLISKRGAETPRRFGQ